MRVLVAVGSKHGATAEIGETIGQALAGHGHEPTVVAVEEAPPLEAFDAVVIGSAVYGGHWLGPARDFVHARRSELTGVPVWLFSSGPVGDPPKPREDPVDVVELAEMTGARGHRVFPGKLERAGLGWGERTIATALRAPEGDFRDADAINAWVSEIAESLDAGRAP